MNPLTQSKKTTTLPVLISLVLACFTLSPTARAVTPPPDGGYPGQNTAEGQDALFSLTTGSFNTATGFNALLHNKTGYNNTAVGAQALLLNTAGNFNTANGRQALYSNKTGNNNTATGFDALSGNTTGNYNTANGGAALFFNTIGGSNTANGFQALYNNTGGSANTANGRDALYHNTTAFWNTAMGSRALYSNTTGFSNTANGYQALYLNETGGGNTANGVQALYRTTGGSNIALGFQAGANLTTGDNNIDIGNVGVAAEANTIRIGTGGTQTATFIAGISGKTAAGGIPVIVNANGKLGTTASSARFKDEIKPMDKASEAIHALKPVTFRYKQELDPEGIPQFGLIAEHVEKVNPDLVARDDKGKVYTVRYEAVNAMLLNEFLKEHKKVEKLEATVATLVATVKEQAAQIQKVSAQIEVSKPAQGSEIVLNNE
jgi:trimeric autotransporter adhesin